MRAIEAGMRTRSMTPTVDGDVEAENRILKLRFEFLECGEFRAVDYGMNVMGE